MGGIRQCREDCRHLLVPNTGEQRYLRLAGQCLRDPGDLIDALACAEDGLGIAPTIGTPEIQPGNVLQVIYSISPSGPISHGGPLPAAG